MVFEFGVDGRVRIQHPAGELRRSPGARLPVTARDDPRRDGAPGRRHTCAAGRRRRRRRRSWGRL